MYFIKDCVQDFNANVPLQMGESKGCVEIALLRFILKVFENKSRLFIRNDTYDHLRLTL